MRALQGGQRTGQACRLLFPVETHAEEHHHSRRPRTQSEKRRCGDSARHADRDDGAIGLRQILPRFRHDLRRRPAPLCRVAVGLCTPVPGTDAKAGCGSYRGPLAGYLHRAEDDEQKSAFDRGHRHRDLRLSAPALRARGRALFAHNRTSHRKPDRQPDGGPHPRARRRHAALFACAHRARPQRRIPQGVRGASEEGLPARQGGREIL